MASLAQIAANRSSAQESAGPGTPWGQGGDAAEPLAASARGGRQHRVPDRHGTGPAKNLILG